MKKLFSLRPASFVLFFTTILFMNMNQPALAQHTGYQKPPAEIMELVDAPLTPFASLGPSNHWMLLIDRPSMPSIEEVAQEELRLAGIRINPLTNGSSRAFYYDGLRFKSVNSDEERLVSGLPKNPKIENISWSPDGNQIAFTITVSKGMELWTADAKTAKAKKLSEAIVNDAMSGIPYKWFSDNQTMIYKAVADGRQGKPAKSGVPDGPTIQENSGKTAPVRTYQDLLKNQYDEQLFEYFTTAQLKIVGIQSGQTTNFGEAGIISGFAPSPDGQYILVNTIQKPFSYIVPYSRFPFTAQIFDRSGRSVKTIATIPSAENIPKGFGAVRTGPRSFNWRADQPAMMYWVEAQDGGDPKKETDIRDQLYSLNAPFTTKPEPAISFENRYGGITWGADQLAIAYEWWWTNRREVTSKWNPSNPTKGKKVIFDRSWEDRYTDPGSFETTQNKYGRSVLMTAENGKQLFLMGQGASPEGKRPFIDQFNIDDYKTERLWRSEAPYYEYPISIIDEKKGIVLTRRESTEAPPNYVLRNLNDGQLQKLTSFTNPYKSLEAVDKQVVKYKREDGVELSGTLYLPAGYDKEKDGRLPVLMWAYPREFKSAKAAGQNTDSPYEFIRIGWGSPLYWVTQGYAVFDDFGMPIIGEGDEEPNEKFVQQLRSGAQAAVDKLYDLGIADTTRLAVGGHSYGAFMTANLLAHTDIFAAGIARSGAYNRTLTPFGFQSEERTFWEATETYMKMSPFMHADKIEAPILLIHGEADNNSGTYPMQSERFFAALKGHGATVRLVMLPHESHGYRARASILHMMWEMTEWLDTHVKNKKMVEEKETVGSEED